MSTQHTPLARGLGWFSIALGAAELLAPRGLARWLGMPNSAPILAAYGVREIGTGMGILSSDDPTGWVWGRVGGDALDVATLATGLTDDNPKRSNVAFALAAVLGVTLLDAACANGLQQRQTRRRSSRRFVAAYRTRSGFGRAPHEMRGAARDFVVPEDMRTPKALRPLAV
jgi:hypothetical protein